MSSGSATRVIVAGAVSLVLGLALGGLAPRAENRSLRMQVDELQDRECGGNGVGREIAAAVQGEPWKAALEDDAVEAIDRGREAEAEEEEEEEEEGVRFEFDVGDGDELEPETVEEGIQMAKDAMSLRQTQARAALDEQAAPSDGQWDAIDAAIDDMNADLAAISQDFVDQVGDGGEPSRREALLFASETLDVILDADDRIYGALDADQRAGVDEEAIDPLSHIDPGLLDVFLELEQ